MFLAIKKDKWLVIKVIVYLSIAIPVIITTYEFIVLGNESVMFLADYPIAVSIIILIYYAILLAVGIIWIIMQLKSLLELKKEKRKTELLHLQSQVNPHFFFNILNNLYGLVGTDAKKAQKLILKLSDMMRYSIYEGEKETVTLEEEIDYLKNYIELHKIRYHKKIDVIFKSNIQENYKVKPLLFIILLENAFKHGVENLRENAYMHTKMITKEKKIYFEVENNFDPEIPGTSGIGLENLKRRLDLVYPNMHNLSFVISNNVYKVKLTLTQL